MKKPNNKQCELARVITGSYASDEQIITELSSKIEIEWGTLCGKIGDEMSRYDASNEKYPLEVWSQFATTGEEYQVDAATVFLAYVEWCEEKNI
ncbi:MAG: hypothetical protein LUH07_01735 [Lachnospiraceae bacterium]|nr:hypothetical protein [Lachnospiraceae bacterium]